MSYKNLTRVMIIVIIISMSCFIGISIYAAPTIQKIGMSPATTEVLAGSEAVALTVKASGSKLTYEWMLQGQGTLQEPTTQPAVFYIPPQKLDVESVQVMISIIVKDEQGEEATESIFLRIIDNIDNNDVTVSSTPTPPPSASNYDDYIIDCENREKIDSKNLAYPFRNKRWIIEWLKVCETGGWNIAAWEIVKSERICRYKIRLYDEEEVRSTLAQGNLFASKGIMFNPQDIRMYPEGKQDRCQSEKESAWTIGVVAAYAQ